MSDNSSHYTLADHALDWGTAALFWIGEVYSKVQRWVFGESENGDDGDF